MSEVDPEIEAEEARLNRIMAKGGNPVKITPSALGSASLKPTGNFILASWSKGS